MTTSYKNPPALDEDKSYETWKSEIDIWRLMTDVEKRAAGVSSGIIAQRTGSTACARNRGCGFKQGRWGGYIT